MKNVAKILKNDLCLGCGLCEAIDSSYKMKLTSRGFYKPQLGDQKSKQEKIIVQLCPGINIHGHKTNNNTSSWGNVELVTNAWASDKEVRKSSSSGGITSALAIYLLESNQVDAILHVGIENNSFLYNRLQISRTKEDILKRNSSRYAPALIFDNIFNILNKNTDTYAFIGKPCDIAGMKNILSFFPQYKNRIKFYLSIFCAGMPNYNASIKAINTFKKTSKPISLQYRGNGWPGFFTVKYEDGSISKMTYNESWGNILGKELGFRCKICPDGIGLLSDISSGDAWNTKNGYPDFTESDGKNFCFIRTKEGKQLFTSAEKAGYINQEKLDIDKIRYMQNYQYTRRHYVGWRILIVQLLTGNLLSFRNLGYNKLILNSNFIKGVKEALGTIKRLHKVRNNE